MRPLASSTGGGGVELGVTPEHVGEFRDLGIKMSVRARGALQDLQLRSRLGVTARRNGSSREIL